MVTVYTSPHAEARLQAARDWLLAQRAGQRALIVCPQPLASRTLLRSQFSADAQQGRPQALLDIDTWTPHQLVDRYATLPLAEAGKMPLNRRARELLCAQLLTDPHVRSQLGPLLRIADQPSCPRVLAKTIDELRLSEVDADQVGAHSPHLAVLLRAYNSALFDRNLADELDKLNLARQGVLAADARMRHGRVLLQDVPTRFPAEDRLLQALCEHCDQALWTIPSGDERTAQKATFGEHASDPAQTFSPDPQLTGPQVPDRALRRLQAGLFAGVAQPGAADESVRVLSAAGEERECVELARHLLWAAETGVPFERMAVLPRRGPHYAAYLSEAFSRAGIPAYFADRTRRPDPAGRALLALLQCKAEGYRASRFAEYLALRGSVLQPATTEHEKPFTDGAAAVCVLPEGGVLGRHQPALGPEPSPQVQTPMALPSGGEERPYREAGHRWEHLLARAAVVRGRERFSQRLQGLLAELNIARNQTEARGQGTEALDHDLNDLQALIDHIEPLLSALEQLPQSAPLPAWLEALQALAVRALAHPERVLSVLAELRPMVGTRELQTAPLDLDRLLRMLSVPLSDILQRDASRVGGRVFVADARAARGMAFDIVCVPGLAEKVFPERVREDPLLLDALRRKLSPELTTQEQRVDNERLYLRLAVGAANDQLVLSYPRLDLERGRPRVPSFYLLEALRAAEGTLPSYDNLMLRAESHAAMHSGLPAPRDRSRSIDACEHDLATLSEPITESQPGKRAADTMGVARYLLLTNPYLARALRARARRWTVRTFGPDDGLVASSVAVKALLARHRPGARAYSASTLSEYAHCPYRFYLRAIAKLSERAQPTAIDRMHPLHRAALINDCQFQLLQQIKAGALPEPGPAALGELGAALDTITEHNAHAYRKRLCPTVDRVFDDGVARIRADLQTWLKQLSAAAPFKATHAELCFGLPGHRDADPQSVREPVKLDCGLQLRGAIDLVEAAQNALRATSHHTGRARAPQYLRIDGGRHLQPLLYGLTLKALYPGRGTYSGRLHYCTAKGRFESREVVIDDAAEQEARAFADTLDAAIDSGMLPAAPERDACDRCDYLSVCGPHERERTQRKRPNQLTALAELRRRP